MHSPLRSGPISNMDFAGMHRWKIVIPLNLILKLCLHVVFANSSGETTPITAGEPRSRVWYVSHFNGTKNHNCGSQSLPCWSISTVVDRAKSGDWIYLDGTNSKQSPYDCDSIASSQMGIYVNKSLSIKGIRSTAHLQCGSDKGVTFEGSYERKIAILLSNIVFETTFLRFQDSSVEIEGCTFLGSLYAVNFTLKHQRTTSLQVQHTSFSNNYFCINVEVKENLQSPNLNLVVKQSLFHANLAHWKINGAIGIWIPKPLSNSVFVNVTLSDTRFVGNNFGKGGIIGVFLDQGNLQISSTNLTFFHNNANYLTSSLFELWGADVKVTDHNSRLVNNSGRAVLVSGSEVQAHIHNTSYINHMNDKSGGVIFVEKGRSVNISFENTKFIGNHANQNGGVICIDDTNKDVRLTLTSVRFLSNNAGTYGGTIAIGSSPLQFHTPLGVDHLIIELHDVHFNLSSGTTHGGSLYYNAKGNASIMVSNTIFYSNTAGMEGGAVSGVANEMEMNIQNSTISLNSCPAGGGALYFQIMRHCLISAKHSTFFRNSASSSGGAISIIQAITVNLTLSDVKMISNSALGLGGGAIHFNPPFVSKYILRILNSNFSDNTAMESHGGSIYMKGQSGEFVMADTVFDSNKCNFDGGSLYLVLQDSVVQWSGVLFTNSESGRSGGAVTMKLSGTNGIHIRNSLFKTNWCGNLGGAMLISMSSDILNSSNCLEKREWETDDEEIPSKGYRTWNYRNRVVFIETHFQQNIASNGGAVYLQNGETTFENCSFIDNFATFQGGSVLSVGDSTSLLIYNTSFLQTKTQIAGPNRWQTANLVQEFIHTDSEGPLVLTRNTVIMSRTFGNVNPMLMITKGGYINLDATTSLICPVGALLGKQNYSHTFNAEMCSSNKTCTLKVTVLGLSCQICGLGSYSLQYGYAQGINIHKGFVCLPCPAEGANCSRNVKAKPNFWGYEVGKNPTRLRFVPCPLNYCQPPKSLDQSVYNGCQGNRSGWLCGACQRGYSATLFSTECRHNDECRDSWFWLVAGLYTFLMAWYLIHKPPLMTWVFKHIFWFKKPMQDPQVSQETEDSNFDAGYLKIVFYFYQVASLLLVTTSTEGLLTTHFVLPIVGFFNFQQFFPASGGGFVCPFIGLEFVTKQLFRSLEVFVVIFFTVLIYLLQVILCKLCRKEWPNSGRYLAAALETLLLGYATFASTSLKLLHCITIDSEKRLFFDANIVCYQSWQMLLIAVVAIFFVPFIIVLASGSVWLYNGDMSAKQFLCASLFPFFFLFYLLYKCACIVCHSGARVETNTANDQKRQIVREDPTTRMLCDPFRRPDAERSGTLYWESVLIGRRFVLVIMHSLITDPSLRLTCLTLTCVLILVHHMTLKPFRDPKANSLETFSLLALVVIATLNLMQASTELVGLRYTGSGVFAIVETILLGLLPSALLLVLLLGVISLVVRMLYALLEICFRAGKCIREESEASAGETSALLDPTA